MASSAAEEKITTALSQEIEAVEKQYMRKMQVRGISSTCALQVLPLRLHSVATD